MPAAGDSSVLGAELRGFAARIAVAPEERTLAGAVSGVFYVIGAISLIPLVVLGAGGHRNTTALILICCAAFAWGACSLVLIKWDRASPLVMHASALSGIALIALSVAESGGSVSPAWVLFFLVVVFAAYFFPPPTALAYVALVIATMAGVFAYDDEAATSGRFISRLAIASASYLAIAGAIMAGKRLLETFRARAELLAAEQGALRRVATAVVGGDPAEQIYQLVAHEAAALLGAGAAGIIRFDRDNEATVMGSWADHEGGRYPPGTVIEVGPGSDVARARDTQLPV
jgi:hypothetical protein